MKGLRIIVLASILTLPGAGWSADAGTTGAQFLKLGIGPRATAMGDAQVGLADDVYANFWNPAGLAQLQTPQAGFVQTEYIQDITEQYAAYAHPTTSLGTFGGSFTYLNVTPFQGYDAAAQPIGNVGANDAALGLSYAYPMYKDRRYGTMLAAGVNAKWIEERLDTVSARSYAADGGLLFVPGTKWGEGLQGWRAGLALRNIGTPLKFDTESFDLPRSLTAGLSYTGQWRGESFTLALDGQQPNDGPRVFGAGLEVVTLKALVIRGGYTSAGDLGDGLRAGAGLRFKTFQIDYAYAGAGSLGSTNRLGLTIFFGQKKTDPLSLAESRYEKGRREFNEHRYSEALEDFNKALQIDPSHPQVKEMMDKAYEKLDKTLPE